VKACVNLLRKPCLYVKSLEAEYGTPQESIAGCFQRARDSAPCILVLEDLDSLIDDNNRAYFLNEMDGFAANTGILTIATTNHPERLDPAILERPSRFDRKYHFHLPGVEGRKRYISGFAARLEPELRLDEEGLDRVAEATEGYSYAYLRELYLSAMMSWINAMHRPIRDIMLEQASVLRGQMQSAPELEVKPSGSGNGSHPGMPRPRRRRARR
jgi:SpoVK/Ycf46/Vps4 family AAA+-type ATPase